MRKNSHTYYMRTLVKIGTALTLLCSLLLFSWSSPIREYPRQSLSASAENRPTEQTHSQAQKNVYSSRALWNTDDVDISMVDPSRKLISFTFDDAPASTLDSIVAAFLQFNRSHKSAPASATIFCNGMRIHASTKPSVELALTAGFELGNHTQNHKDLSKLSAQEIGTEIEKTDRLLSRFDGKAIHLLRPPYGNITDGVKLKAQAPIVSWFIDTKDWTGIPPEEIYNRVWQGKHSGVIVLMHDGYTNTVSALKRLLPDLYNAGYQVVSVSQMAKAHGCKMHAGGVYTRARKPSDIR